MRVVHRRASHRRRCIKRANSMCVCVDAVYRLVRRRHSDILRPFPVHERARKCTYRDSSALRRASGMRFFFYLFFFNKLTPNAFRLSAMFFLRLTCGCFFFLYAARLIT